MKRTIQVFAAIMALVSLDARAEIVSSKGRPVYPIPSDCNNASGHTYSDTSIENYDFPQLNGTELLACNERKFKKKYFRLRLKILVKKTDGVNENQVADEVIIPWRRGVNPRILSVAGPGKCTANEITILPTEIGPFVLGKWVQQPDDSLLLRDVISAWKIDKESKSIVMISSKNLVCTDSGC